MMSMFLSNKQSVSKYMCNNYSFETHHQLMSILMYIPYEQSKFQHITDSLILIDKLASAIISSCIYTVHVF